MTTVEAARDKSVNQRLDRYHWRFEGDRAVLRRRSRRRSGAHGQVLDVVPVPLAITPDWLMSELTAQSRKPWGRHCPRLLGELAMLILETTTTTAD